MQISIMAALLFSTGVRVVQGFSLSQRSFPALRLFRHSSFSTDGNQYGEYMEQRDNPFPARTDTCKVFISGVIGSDIKEYYLKNDHYVIAFSLAVMGHFEPVSDWEKKKVTETMWVNAEVWDDEAKKVNSMYSKGSKFAGIGTIIVSKWKDKVSQEDRKMLKIRVTKPMNESDLKDILAEIDIGDSNTNFKEETEDSEEFDAYSEPAPYTNQDNVAPLRSPNQTTRTPTAKEPMQAPPTKMRDNYKGSVPF